MKTLVFILIAIPYVVFGQCYPPSYGTLKAEVNGSSVVLKNDTITRNCAVNYLMEVTQIEGDTLVWFELEQSVMGEMCTCNFNLSVTLDSLEAGDYYAKTYFTKMPFPIGDTCYIGLISFTITEQNSFNGFVVTNSYQSDCFTVGVPTQDQPDNDKMIFNPNPSKDKITISSSAITGNTQLSIFNVNGEKVIEMQLTYTETQIDISTLPRGVYFVKLQNEKMVEVGKMVKE
jgi:hypothetical protein